MTSLDPEGPHPFESAFKVIKEMRQELRELRAALQAEQQQRASEVSDLQREVADLKAALAKENAQQVASYQKLSNAHETEMKARMGDVDELKAICRKNFNTLHTALEEEARDRKADVLKLQDNVGNFRSDWRTDSDAIHQELEQQKNTADDDRAISTKNFGYVTHDMYQVVNYVGKISGAWEAFKNADKLTIYAPPLPPQ